MACLCLTASPDAAGQNIAYPVSGAVDEYWDPSGRALVGGEIVAGVMLGDRPRQVPEPVTFTSLIDTQPVVCLSLVSRDGAYSYRAEYVLTPPADEDVTSLAYDPRHPEAFEAEVPVGLRLTLGRCTERQTAFAIVAPSAGDLAAADSVTVFINGLNADRVRLGLPGTGQRVACDRDIAGRTTGFNFACRIPRALATGELQVAVERFRGTTALDPVFFRLVSP